MEKIALFGGSFNPPHWGHRQVLDFLRGLVEFDEVWMMPSYDHPYDKGLVPYSDRLEMCRLTLSGLSRVSLCSIEGELKNKPSYMVDTIKALEEKYPSHAFTLAVGSDLKKELPQWRSWDLLRDKVKFFFLPRPGIEPSPFMRISSSEIRRLIHEKKSYTKYLVPEVARYIREHHLYEAL